MTDAPIRDAATLIVLRQGTQGPSVLMGQRGRNAAFMPSRYVFPGGAVDPADRSMSLARPLPRAQDHALTQNTGLDAPTPHALAAAALRECFEETGLRIGAPHPAPPEGWGDLAPDASRLQFIFRAITPPGRPRRFDARFFLAPADALSDPPDALTGDGELSHLHWVPLSDARRLPMPFITEVVLAEVARHAAGTASADVPFYRHDDEASTFQRLRGRPMSAAD